MRDKVSPILKLARVKSGYYGSTDNYGHNGVFIFRGPEHRHLRCFASDQKGWEHVSCAVQGSEETPTWQEMCYVKDLFWQPEEWVVQFHPAESVYVNLHKGVLHLWRPIGVTFPIPPVSMV